MSTEDNKAIVHRFFEEETSKGKLNAANELLSPDFTLHVPLPVPAGIEGIHEVIITCRAAFEHLNVTIENMIAENEFFRAYNLALKTAGSVQGTISRIEKLRAESDLEESELYVELQDRIKAAEAQASQLETQTDRRQEKNNGIEKDIELLRKQYATKKTAVLEVATIKLRAIALGR